MAVSVADVEYALTRKLGAVEDREGHHVFFYLTHQGNEHTVGKLSHSWRGDLNDTQVTMCAKYLRLQKQEFERFVTCHLDTDNTIAPWESRNPYPRPSTPTS